MRVRVLPKGHEREVTGRDYVRVSTCNDPMNDTVTLATIERVIRKQDAPTAGTPEVVKTLVTNLPMPADEAIGLATSYAQRKHIAFVYTDQ